MASHATGGVEALTDKEKQTLRLIVRGHDVKSIATTLGLSVHTINERLRDARRKLAVSSSREAARLLLAAEEAAPEKSADRLSGDDVSPASVDPGAAPIVGVGTARRRSRFLIGAIVMPLMLGLLALTLSPATQQTPPPPPATLPATPAPEAAKRFLLLVDQGRWDDSYRLFGVAFRKLNTAEVWAKVSEKVRTPLGQVQSRELIGEEYLPAPPYGYQVVKFRTRFAGKAEPQVETVTLDQEQDDWRVVGVTIG
ncbi:helix-turn-helix domain-containing protein [Sphingomonas silueang]|uniref:helix-turn-helix domain-containing protein n=1 Tax=Sphingomonas silueang TaxID=3156617 RepID=UPI0032B46CA2